MNKYGDRIYNIEVQVEEEYVTKLRLNCYREKNQSKFVVTIMLLGVCLQKNLHFLSARKIRKNFDKNIRVAYHFKAGDELYTLIFFFLSVVKFLPDFPIKKNLSEFSR